MARDKHGQAALDAELEDVRAGLSVCEDCWAAQLPYEAAFAGQLLDEAAAGILALGYVAGQASLEPQVLDMRSPDPVHDAILAAHMELHSGMRLALQAVGAHLLHANSE